MKRFVTVFFIIFTFLSLNANPVQEIFFSELTFQDTSWQIELFDYGEYYNGWCIVSGSDTIQFNETFTFSTNLLVIEQKDFDRVLNIDSAGDTLLLFDFENNLIDSLAFGQGGQVAAPKAGQSICAKNNSLGGLEYYLDSTPTMGYLNDTEDAYGIIDGYIVDLNDNPLSEVKIIYDENYFYGNVYKTTDSTGYFKISTLAKITSLSITKDGYSSSKLSLQIYPEETTILDTIRLKKVEELDYYPLSIGNKWMYEYSTYCTDDTTGESKPSYTAYTYDVIIETVGDTVSNSTDYYKLLCKKYDPYSDISKEYFYERYDSTQSWCVLLKHSFVYPASEYTLIDLAVTLDDSVSYYFWDYNDTKVEINLNYFADSTITLFNNETTAKNFISDSATENYFVQIAKGFGIARQEMIYDDSSVMSKLKLKGCIINNIVYGDTALIVGINEKDSESKLPQSFSLSQNYPNPFNPTTNISYTIPNDKTSYFVTIKIYDTLGRLVKTLVNEEQSAGTYVIQWNGLNQLNNRVSSGIYFYSVQAGEMRITKKMVMLQ